MVNSQTQTTQTQTITLTLVRGLPGSGKSTWARQAAQKASGVVLEADAFFESGGVYRFDPTQLKAAHEWCQARTEQQLKLGFSVWVANTFTREWEIAPYREIARQTNAQLRIVEITLGPGDLDLCMLRGLHHVPEAAYRAMLSRWESIAEAELIPMGK